MKSMDGAIKHHPSRYPGQAAKSLAPRSAISRILGHVRGHVDLGGRAHERRLAIMVASPRRRLQALGFGRSAALCKKYPLQIGRISENAGLFHGLGSLRTGRHRARLFERRQRVGFQIGFGTLGFLFLDHAN
jgi:hypothetical protein